MLIVCHSSSKCWPLEIYIMYHQIVISFSKRLHVGPVKTDQPVYPRSLISVLSTWRRFWLGYPKSALQRLIRQSENRWENCSYLTNDNWWAPINCLLPKAALSFDVFVFFIIRVLLLLINGISHFGMMRLWDKVIQSYDLPLIFWHNISLLY